MSEPIVKPAEPGITNGQVKQLAVVQNGTITPQGEYIRFADPKGAKFPVVHFVTSDRTRAVKARKRVQRLLDNTIGIGGESIVLGTAILDIVEIETPAPRKREAKPATTTPAATNGSEKGKSAAGVAGSKK